MFCPKCRIEYQEGIEECTECHTPLVDELPPEPEGEYIEWVTVLTSLDHNTVMVAASLLGDAGMPIFIKSEGLKNLFMIPIAEEVQVMPENVAEARLLLEGGGIQPDQAE